MRRMIIGSFFTALMSLFLWACGDKNTPGEVTDPENGEMRTEIKIKVQGMTAGKCKLGGYYGNQRYLADSFDADEDGNVTITRNDTIFPWGYYFLILPDEKNYIQMLLGPDQVFTMETSLNNINMDMKVKGDINNELYYENIQWESNFQSEIKPSSDKLAAAAEGTPEWEQAFKAHEVFTEKRKNYIKEITDRHPNSVFSIFKVSGQNPDLRYPKKADNSVDKFKQVWYYRNEYWPMTDFSAGWLLRTPVYHNKLENYITKYTDQNVDSLILYSDKLIDMTKENSELFKYTINWIALQYKKPEFMGADEVYAHIIQKYFTENQTPWEKKENLIRVRGEARTILTSALGNTGQDFTATDPNGEPISLYGSISAPITVLYMYSYDCENCRKETPEVVKMYNEWKDKGVDVYALCLEDNEEKWKEYMAKNNMSIFNNAIDPDYKSGYHQKYHLDVTPELYVLNKDKKIIAKDLKSFQLPPVFEKELGKQ